MLCLLLFVLYSTKWSQSSRASFHYMMWFASTNLWRNTQTIASLCIQRCAKSNEAWITFVSHFCIKIVHNAIVAIVVQSTKTGTSGPTRICTVAHHLTGEKSGTIAMIVAHGQLSDAVPDSTTRSTKMTNNVVLSLDNNLVEIFFCPCPRKYSEAHCSRTANNKNDLVLISLGIDKQCRLLDTNRWERYRRSLTIPSSLLILCFRLGQMRRKEETRQNRDSCFMSKTWWSIIEKI
jgi:hypothetical protein